ncbi:hypothetical protein CFP65_6350 [Kitasatospora sp. MMS16-BH015]|uniref:hypothetical protein n=1 Tax=Kitasatospora sp. MMS16-BH015 TaxID=2018025 RepID=UPI000CA31962|nr:hypothetical protein [Kitasatospora sp. MMS16-BH015]AUG81008.1 hypothetical protein CFP65_6350 [Kitasatospora sp. MMS16-BH015]
MRTLIQVELDTAASNQLMAEGRIGDLMGKTLEQLKPEAAYFFPLNGHRAMFLVVDLADEAALVTSVEPFWTQANAKVTMVPCMNAEDLTTGIGRFLAGQA